jgi:hypothetical protein
MGIKGDFIMIMVANPPSPPFAKGGISRRLRNQVVNCRLSGEEIYYRLKY